MIPIPDSSTTAAHQLAVDLGVPYREGFVKNRYIGRTFIMPYQEERKKVSKKKKIEYFRFRVSRGKCFIS